MTTTNGRIRPLSARAAATCETSKTNRCRCRCGGLLHGANRVGALDPVSLPDDDGHHAGPPREQAPTAEANLALDLTAEPALDLVADYPDREVPT